MNKVDDHQHLVSSLLQKIKRQELLQFLQSYSKQNTAFKTDLLLHFADKISLSGSKKYDVLIQSIIRGSCEEKVELDQPDLPKIATQVGELLKHAEEQLMLRNYLDPFNLATAVVEQLRSYITGGEKTDPVLNDRFARCFFILNDLLNSEAGPDLKDSVFNFALIEAQKFSDYRNSIKENCYELLLNAAFDHEKQKQVLDLFDQIIKNIKRLHIERDREQQEEFYLRKKISLLEKMGRADAAQQVIDENLNITSFRKEVIDKAIKEGDFASAKALIRESKMINQQKGRLYLTSEWDKRLLKIAIEEKDISNIRTIGLRLFYDQFDISYYRVIRKTYTAERWPAEAQKIIESIKAEANFGVKGIHALAVIMIEEQWWLQLLHLVQKNASLEFAEDYYHLLKDKFPVELVDVYREALRRYAEHNMGREHYEILVSTLKKIQSLPTGKDVSRALSTEFKVKYAQRGNMVKALNKLVF
jgi:hypothetical protein